MIPVSAHFVKAKSVSRRATDMDFPFDTRALAHQIKFSRLQLRLGLHPHRHMQVRVVHPKAMSNYAQARMQRAKTDQMDALMILRLCPAHAFCGSATSQRACPATASGDETD